MVFLMRIKLLLLLFFVSPFLAAQEGAAEKNSLTIELKTLVPTLIASPNTCELSQGEQRCQQQVSLIWEVPKAGHFCLWQKANNQLLKCWDNVWSGTHSIAINSEQSQSFYLTRGDKGVVVATTSLAVISALEQRLRAKRRRGFWRLF